VLFSEISTDKRASSEDSMIRQNLEWFPERAANGTNIIVQEFHRLSCDEIGGLDAAILPRIETNLVTEKDACSLP
jgi:hypothetical protein